MAETRAPTRRWPDHPRVRALRERSPVADIGVRMVEGFREHRIGQNTALISHFGFLSVFPLMLVLTTVLGFVLQGRPRLREEIVGSAMERVPIIGPQLAADPATLTGNWLVLIFGLLTALWAGMKAFVALHGALDDIAEVPLLQRPNLAVVRWHAIVGIGVVGVGQIASAILASLVGALTVGAAAKTLLIVGALSVNIGVLMLSYRWLATRRAEWRALRPGAIAGGVVFTGLQLFGAVVAGRAASRATAVYGTFAAVIGVLTWLSLHALAALLGAELNEALRTRRGPRQVADGC